MAPVSYITNVQSFCAAHRLNNPDLSEEENKKQYGRCNHISSHGHNYKIEATVRGEIIPHLGFAMNLTELKKILFTVIDPLDHKRLDTDIEFFKQKEMIATAEILAIYIWEEMEKLLPNNVELYRIRIHETERNYIEYRGENHQW